MTVHRLSFFCISNLMLYLASWLGWSVWISLSSGGIWWRYQKVIHWKRQDPSSALVSSSLYHRSRNMTLKSTFLIGVQVLQCTHLWATGVAWMEGRGWELWELEALDRWGWDLPLTIIAQCVLCTVFFLNNTIWLQVRLAKAMGNTVTAISTSPHKETVARWM